jgi:hypothetical protein
LSTPSLFPPTTEEIIERLDRQILALLMGGTGGPLNYTLSAGERKILEAIRYHRGRNRAVSLEDIQSRTGINGRNVKHFVRCLRMNFQLPIGSSKHAKGGGYFLMVEDADVAVWRTSVLDQVRAEIAVLRAAAGAHVVQELLGQLSIEIKPALEVHRG